MKTEQSHIITRFAPSPTGHLHIGSLRTALFNWLFARHYSGTFLIRIEDTDLERSLKEYEQSLLASLEWSGIVSDEPLMYQQQRLDIYRKVAQQLINQKDAYRCFCSQELLEQKRERVTAAGLTYQYDKTCRTLSVDDQDLSKPHVIRFAVNTPDAIFTFQDHIKGLMEIACEQVDDFVLVRSDGAATYNFAVVVDDIAMHISHIIRGEEHLFNTPKQILLYQALQAKVPQFAHIPLILGNNGQKLSKRDGATCVIEYKKEGFLAIALCNYLVRLGWSHGDQEIFSFDEMITFFSLDHVQKSGAKFDIEKLKWVNSHYIKQLTVKDLQHHLLVDVGQDLVAATPEWSQQQRDGWIRLYQDRVSTLRELYHYLVAVYTLPERYELESLSPDLVIRAQDILQSLGQMLTKQIFDKALLQECVKQWCKDHTIKMGDVGQLLRMVMIGAPVGPSVFDMISLLGKEEFFRRLELFSTIKL